jgi:polar amino acid transport system substrate-binding protein
MKTLKLLATCLISLVTAVTAHARPLDEVKKSGTMIVATEGQYAPFNYFQGSKLSGFEIELAELAAKKMGVAIEWKALSFDALLAGLRQDRWDLVIASHGITPEREKAVTFANPHYCSGGVIVATDPVIHTVPSLRDKVVAVQVGTTYLQHVQQLGLAKEVKTFPQDTDARSALITHRVDAWVTDRFVAKLALDANPSSGMHLGDYVFVERIAAAVAKGNTSLVQAYNQALAQVMADGSYEALSKKYFNEDVRCK